jgi:hypothetical protein
MAQKPMSESATSTQPRADLTGYSKTEEVRVTTTILGEVGGVQVFLRRQAAPGGTIEFCQRCWTDIKTGITTCVPIDCPKTVVGPAGPDILA